MVCYSIKVNEVFGRFLNQRQFMQGLAGDNVKENEIDYNDKDLIQNEKFKMSNILKQFSESFQKKLVTNSNGLALSVAGLLDKVTKKLDKFKLAGSFKWLINKPQQAISNFIQKSLNHFLKNEKLYSQQHAMLKQCLETQSLKCLGQFILESIKQYNSFLKSPLIPPSILQYKHKSWKANLNSKFTKMTVEQYLEKYGVNNYIDKEEIKKKYKEYKLNSEQMNEQDELYLNSITNYDLRIRYPQCILEPRNQGQCGSCWAFAGVRVLQERLCIKTQKPIPQLSTQYLVSCYTQTKGCDGSDMSTALLELEEKGTVTDQCLPYHSTSGQYQECSTLNMCKPTSKYFFKQGSLQFIEDDVEAAKQQLLAKGSLFGYMEIYEDFYLYESGIYQNPQGANLGGHAVTIIGFGEQNGESYWIGANSWGTEWGEKGYFKIKMGVASTNLWFFSSAIEKSQFKNNLLNFFGQN